MFRIMHNQDISKNQIKISQNYWTNTGMANKFLKKELLMERMKYCWEVNFIKHTLSMVFIFL